MPKKKKYESEIESTAAAAILTELGVFSIKLRKAQEAGYPDRIFLIHGGVPLFIEFKREGKAPDEYQLMIHRRLRHAGYQVEVHDTVEGAVNAVRAALEARPRTTTGRRVVAATPVSGTVPRPRKR